MIAKEVRHIIDSAYDRDSIKKMESSEEILKENPGRWVVLPIKYPAFWSIFKAHELGFWTAEDISIEDSKADDLIKKLSFLNLSRADSIRVYESLAHYICFEILRIELCNADMMLFTCKCLEDVEIPEARAFYGFEAAAHTIHRESSERLAASIHLNPLDYKNKLKDIAEHKKAFITSIISEDAPACDRFLGVAIINSVFTAGRGILHQWSLKNKVFSSFCNTYDRITKDEHLHTYFACEVFRTLKNRPSQEAIRIIVDLATKIEFDFLLRILPLDAMKISKDEVSLYMESCSTVLLKRIEGECGTSPSRRFSWSPRDFSFFDDTVEDLLLSKVNGNLRTTSTGGDSVSTFTFNEEF